MKLWRALSAILCAAMLISCGYSEDEWQAQLEKYNQLNKRHEDEQAAHAKTRKELQAAKARVAMLEDQLRKMGLDVENLSAQLEAAGSSKEELANRLAQMNRALEEYKARAAQLEKIKARFELLRKKLEKLTNLGLKVQVRHNRMVISLPGDVLFASGQAKLRKEGEQVVQQVSDVIRKDATLSKRYFQVAGHTDNKPLKGGRFGDNWGLSAMRAREVLLYMIAPVDSKGGGGGLDPERLHAAGYADTDPVASNDGKDGRQQNRRVELVLMPDVEEMLDLKSLL